jgi:serine/threonine-protein kinase RsbW
MAVRIERPEGLTACVIHVDGDMDSSVVPEMRALIEAEVCAGCTIVVMDLSCVTYADSSALGLIVWLDARLAPMGGKVVLAGADRNVNRVLELSGLIGLAPSIAMAGDTEAALAGLNLPQEVSEPAWEEALTMPALLEKMSSTRSLVCDLVAPLGLTEGALFDVKVAVGEALANAVRHGSPKGGDDEVLVTVSAYDDRVVIGVRDTGEGFDGDPLAGDDVYASGGRGVMFMRALMDRVEFTRCDDGGTLVRLTKRLSQGGGPVVVGA